MHAADPALSPLQFAPNTYKIVHPNAETKRKRAADDDNGSAAKKPYTHSMGKLKTMMQRQLAKITTDRVALKARIAKLQADDVQMAKDEAQLRLVVGTTAAAHS